mmetsp:Transcript_9850/g.11813  ORF Transcript_9850/g.11813 Transcript_9850/m.11813 type:complete len:203 (+) Transcript_9850:197-805(+)
MGTSRSLEEENVRSLLKYRNGPGAPLIVIPLNTKTVSSIKSSPDRVLTFIIVIEPPILYEPPSCAVKTNETSSSEAVELDVLFPKTLSSSSLKVAITYSKGLNMLGSLYGNSKLCTCLITIVSLSRLLFLENSKVMFVASGKITFSRLRKYETLLGSASRKLCWITMVPLTSPSVSISDATERGEVVCSLVVRSKSSGLVAK